MDDAIATQAEVEYLAEHHVRITSRRISVGHDTVLVSRAREARHHETAGDFSVPMALGGGGILLMALGHAARAAGPMALGAFMLVGGVIGALSVCDEYTVEVRGPDGWREMLRTTDKTFADRVYRATWDAIATFDDKVKFGRQELELQPA